MTGVESPFDHVRLVELRQLCDSPSDAFSAGIWCEAANEAVGLVLSAQDAIREWFEAEAEFEEIGIDGFDKTPAWHAARERCVKALARLSQVAPDEDHA